MQYKLKIAFALCNRCHVAMETGSVEKTSSRNINETRVGEILGERTFQVIHGGLKSLGYQMI
jgi:hypothetical protein